MKCEIISIGNELLLGDTDNTNASWLGRFLTEQGVEVSRVHTIGDDKELIESTLDQSISNSKLVITTGGLGPTHDDITKRAVASTFNAEMVLHEPTLAFIRKMFEKRGIPFSRSNYGQAEVPSNCEVLFNSQGTAPGLWFEREEAWGAVLPGIPYEMKHLVKGEVLPRIAPLLEDSSRRLSRYIITAGIGESTLSDDVIGELEEFMSNQLSLAYLPSPQGTGIRISATGRDTEELKSEIDRLAGHIYDRASDIIIGEGREFTLAEAVGECLKEEGLTLAVAESCTGGLVGSRITDIPGSSDYMLGGIVAYSNRSKVELLEIEEQTIHSHGAVSLQTALRMAKGTAERFGADVGISTTGIAGPAGGSEDKPVGTVWIGFWSENRHFALKALFTNDRLVNKERSVAVALEMVRRTVKQIDTMPYGLKPHSV